jgi:hypothetical protein
MKPRKPTELVLYSMLAVSLILALLMSSSIPLKYGVPGGSDSWFHIEVARNWAGESDSHIDIRANNGPYPPVFHWVMTSLHFLGMDWVAIMNMMSAVLYPLALVSTFFLARKYAGGLYSGVLAVTVLLSSFAFYDRFLLPVPALLDVILFPFLAWAFFENRPKAFLGLAIVMAYSHGGYSICLISSFFLYSMIMSKGIEFRQNLWMWLILGIMIIPLVVSSLGILQYSLRVPIPHEDYLLKNPRVIPFYIGVHVSLIALFAIPLLVLKRKTKFDAFPLFWMMSLVPVMLVYLDATMGYLSQALAIAIAILFFRTTSFRKYRLLFPLFFLTVALFHVVIPHFLLLQSDSFILWCEFNPEPYMHFPL